MNAANFGSQAETATVTLYADQKLIGTRTVIMAGQDIAMIPFSCKTTGLDLSNGNYTLSANITSVVGETDLSDNVFKGGWVVLTIPGDVDGDFDVDIFDVVKITSCYGKKQGDPLYNPNADIDDNGVIDIFDVVLCTGHYGQKWP